MYKTPSKVIINQLREKYPPGTRIELTKMNDPYSRLQPGYRGTVEFVDDIGTIFCTWDCGSSLGVVYGEDEVVLIEEAKDER